MEATKEQGTLEGWFILELFGHQKIAGFVKTISLGGDAMLRVDVPEIKFKRRVYDYSGGQGKASETDEAIQAFTKFYAVKSVYAMTPVCAEVAMAAMQSFRTEPINMFEIRQAALPAPADPVECGSVQDEPDGMDDTDDDFPDDDRGF